MENKIKLHGYDKFTIISNEILDNPKLSAKAKGLMAYILSKINLNGWVFSAELISTKMKDGLDSIKSGLKELESNKYLYRERHREESGVLTYITYHIFSSIAEYDSFILSMNEKGENDEK